VIPAYLQDKWMVDNSTYLTIRQDKVIVYKTRGARIRFDCIANDGGVMLLKITQRYTFSPFPLPFSYAG